MRKYALLITLLPLWTMAQPANDQCTNAQSLIVHASGECPALAIGGDNEDATQSSTPACDTTTTFFKDVWYLFNSGPNTEILIDFTFITIDEWGVEVLDGCAGTSVFCDSTAAQYTVPVAPGTTYWLRVFTNADSGSGGVFTICLSGSGVVPVCDGAIVLSDFGTVDLSVCKDGTPDVLDFGSTTTSAEQYAFLLTDANDVLIGVVIPPLDLDTMAVGAYRMHGFSFNGDLVGAVPGTALTQLSSDGQCFEPSVNFIAMNVEICNMVNEARSGAILNAYPNPSDGDFRVRGEYYAEDAELRLSDMSGRILYEARTGPYDVDGFSVRLAGHVAPGTYILSMRTGAEERSVRVVLQ